MVLGRKLQAAWGRALALLAVPVLIVETVVRLTASARTQLQSMQALTEQTREFFSYVYFTETARALLLNYARIC
jgi:ABC-type antimicrobial peptide transport system ATPase subunit